MNVVWVGILLLTSLLSGELPPPPPLLPECISEYVYIWDFTEHPFCDKQEQFGHVYFYMCRIRKYNDYHGWHESAAWVYQCIYEPRLSFPPQTASVVMLPIVSNCRLDYENNICPRISHIP